ncbi:MAG: Flp family type IVb pilin [Deltaproteobacteria bacterium]|nr:Flp family type IVb pilin [Deltaproteobacteria bacterium]
MHTKTGAKKGLKSAIRRLFLDESGQGMTEYIIIVALIAVLSIGAVSLFGDNVRNLFGMAGNALAGDSNVDASKLRTTGADSKRTMKDLKDYQSPP